MRETTRTFIAIPVPDTIGQQLGRRQARLTPELPDCRWTEGATFHLTLAFLGDVRNSDLNDLCRAVASAVEPFERLELQLDGLGAFPSPRKPRVIWAGVTSANPQSLLDLREAIVQATARVGYRPDDPRFHPHITLGRIKSERGRERDLTSILDRGPPWPRGPFTAVEVVTYASALGPDGPSYAPLGRARLAGKKSRPRS